MFDMNDPAEKTTVGSNGVAFPGTAEDLFLNTLMALGAPPQRPKLSAFQPDTEHAAYYRRVEKFWKAQGLEGDSFAFMAYYNTKFVPWLNSNHNPD